MPDKISNDIGNKPSQWNLRRLDALKWYDFDATR